MVAPAPRRIGTYLDRDVWCASINRVSDFGTLAVRHTLVLLYEEGAGLTDDEKMELADQIVRGRPLAIFFAGPDCESMFDCLLLALDTPTSPLLIMTSFSSAGALEATEEFLFGTWPPNERWDEWEGYLLVNLDGPVDVLEDAARPLIAE